MGTKEEGILANNRIGKTAVPFYNSEIKSHSLAHLLTHMYQMFFKIYCEHKLLKAEVNTRNCATCCYSEA